MCQQKYRAINRTGRIQEFGWGIQEFGWGGTEKRGRRDGGKEERARTRERGMREGGDEVWRKKGTEGQGGMEIPGSVVARIQE